MSLKKKALSIVVTATLSIGGYVFVCNKISNASSSKYNEIVKNMEANESYTEAVVESLNTSFNKAGSYKVMNGDIELNITYKHKEGRKTFKIPFTNKKITLLDPEIIKSGSAIALFDFDIESLKECEAIMIDDKNIEVLVPYPVLNEKSVKRKNGSFVLDMENSSNNFDAKLKMVSQSIYSELKETMDARATRGLEDKFDTDAPAIIKDIYTEDMDRVYELEVKTIASIDYLINGFLKNILDSLGVSEEYNINVKLKESRLPSDYQPSEKILKKIEQDLISESKNLNETNKENVDIDEVSAI